MKTGSPTREAAPYKSVLNPYFKAASPYIICAHIYFFITEFFFWQVICADFFLKKKVMFDQTQLPKAIVGANQPGGVWVFKYIV